MKNQYSSTKSNNYIRHLPVMLSILHHFLQVGIHLPFLTNFDTQSHNMDRGSLTPVNRWEAHTRTDSETIQEPEKPADRNEGSSGNRSNNMQGCKEMPESKTPDAGFPSSSHSPASAHALEERGRIRQCLFGATVSRRMLLISSFSFFFRGKSSFFFSATLCITRPQLASLFSLRSVSCSRCHVWVHSDRYHTDEFLQYIGIS